MTIAAALALLLAAQPAGAVDLDAAPRVSAPAAAPEAPGNVLRIEFLTLGLAGYGGVARTDGGVGGQGAGGPAYGAGIFWRHGIGEAGLALSGSVPFPFNGPSLLQTSLYAGLSLPLRGWPVPSARLQLLALAGRDTVSEIGADMFSPGSGSVTLLHAGGRVALALGDRGGLVWSLGVTATQDLGTEEVEGYRVGGLGVTAAAILGYEL